MRGWNLESHFTWPYELYSRGDKVCVCHVTAVLISKFRMAFQPKSCHDRLHRPYIKWFDAFCRQLQKRHLNASNWVYDICDMLIEHIANTLFGLLAHSLQFLIYGTYGFSAQNCFQISFPFVELAYGLTMSLDKTKEIAKILEKIVEILLWKTHGKLPIWLHKIVTSEGYVCLFFVHFECVSTFCMHSACHWAVSIICARECVCACMQSLAAIAFVWRDKPLFLSVAVVTAINAYHTTDTHTVLYVLYLCCLLLLCVVERSLFFSNFFFHSQWLNMDFDRQTI